MPIGIPKLPAKNGATAPASPSLAVNPEQLGNAARLVQSLAKALPEQLQLLAEKPNFSELEIEDTVSAFTNFDNLCLLLLQSGHALGTLPSVENHHNWIHDIAAAHLAFVQQGGQDLASEMLPNVQALLAQHVS